MHQEGAVRDAVDADPFDVADHVNDRGRVVSAHACDRDIADGLLGPHPHEVDRAQDRPGLADRARDLGECSSLEREMDPS